MNTRLVDPGELRRRGLEVLVASLGWVDAVRFLRQQWTIHGYFSTNLGGGTSGKEPFIEIPRLSGLSSHSILLVPGLGAQGGDIARIRDFLDDEGRGAIFAVSRSLVGNPGRSGSTWTRAIRRRALEYARQIRRVPELGASALIRRPFEARRLANHDLASVCAADSRSRSFTVLM